MTVELYTHAKAWGILAWAGINEILKQKRDAVYLSNSDSISCAHGIVGHIA